MSSPRNAFADSTAHKESARRGFWAWQLLIVGKFRMSEALGHKPPELMAS